MNKTLKSKFPDTDEHELEILIANNKDAHCGEGSTIWYTKPLRTNLIGFLNKHNIKSMLDAPCGDFNWMSTIEFDKDFDYLGADINAGFVNRNNRLYGNKFIVLDITDDSLPSKDLMFVRDCLFHLSNQSKLNFFKNFLKADIKYLLTSNHPREKENKNIPDASFDTINWFISPWNFLEPIDTIIDYDESDYRFHQHPYRTMCLWSKEQINLFVTKLDFESNND